MRWRRFLTWKVLILTSVAVCLAIGGGVFAGTRNSEVSYDPTIPDVSVAPYKAIDLQTNDTYYASGYGIKSNGVLRLEVAKVDIVQLTNRYERIQTEQSEIIEIPAGRWRLYDRTTNTEVKPKGG